MTPADGGGGIVVVADSAAAAARLEALTRAASPARVLVVPPADLTAAIVEHAPSVVILAISAPAVARLLATYRSIPRTPPIIVVTSTPHAAWTARARRAGVRAVLRADVRADELAAALAATRAGLLAVHPEAFAVASGDTATAPTVEATAPTPRELEVLEMIAEGMSNRAIAARLKISRHTVKFHVAALLTKLGARSRTEAVTAGVRHGLISL
jgi:two-component system, NarL family, response regulator YdfI